VSIVGGATRFDVHPVYVAGHLRYEPRPAHLGDRSVPNDSAGVATAQIDRWIEVAASYAGAEKAFVDDLVAANPGTIDLEMGLPANTGERTAPRMDLVVAQSGGAIAFWEAKCGDNAELRARADYREDEHGKYLAGIHVIHQLRKYVSWMDVPNCDRRAEVAAAYRRTAAILLALADRFGVPGEAARAAWRELKVNTAAQVILPPGVVVGNYDALDGKQPASYYADERTMRGTSLPCVVTARPWWKSTRPERPVGCRCWRPATSSRAPA
jgi:hypothetical protein